jgi:MFS superfamily sulfate permease-like transporter
MKAAEQQATGIWRYLPILGWLPQYRSKWLRLDFIAGLTIMALLVPEGMAYAQLAGVPPQAAFYAAPAGLILYAIFGTSRQLVVAVSSAVSVLLSSLRVQKHLLALHIFVQKISNHALIGRV